MSGLRVVVVGAVFGLVMSATPPAGAAPGDELGGDTRVSSMGPNGDVNYGASKPAVAYNAVAGEFLVVWSADNNAAALVDGEYEIYAQRIDAVSGALVGGRVRVSDMGSDGTALYGAFNPAVAFNAAQGAYLVVWDGDDNTAPSSTPSSRSSGSA